MLKRTFHPSDALQNTHYVESADGTQIAYRVESQGPALVFVNGFTTSNSYWKYLLERFRNRSTLVNWDLKGHGNSEPAETDAGATIEATVDDLRRVMDAAGVEKATLLGFSLGAQIVTEAWRTMSDRISAVIPILGPFEHTFDAVIPPVVGPLFWRLFEKHGPKVADLLLDAGYFGSKLPVTWKLAKAVGAIGQTVHFEDMEPFFEHFAQVHGPTWAKLGISAHNHSAADVLPDIDVPMLIISGGKDSLAPARLGYRMKELAPLAELCIVPEATHAGLLGQREQIEDRIEQFLLDHELVAQSAATDR